MADITNFTNIGVTDLTISDDITVAGDAEVTGGLTVTGATVLNGGLTMDTDKFTVANTSGNTVVGGTLNVTGDSTLSNLLLTALKLGTKLGTVASCAKIYRFTRAEINSGTVLSGFPEATGYQYIPLFWAMIARGSNAADATSVILQDTNSSPVAIATVAVEALVANAVVLPNSANVTNGAGMWKALTSGKGIRIIKGGSDLNGVSVVEVIVIAAKIPA